MNGCFFLISSGQSRQGIHVHKREKKKREEEGK